MSWDGLVSRLNRVAEPDRRLDAEITAVAIGPDVRVNSVQDIDGWSLDRVTGRRREHLMASDDVPYLTRYLDAAVEAVALARPADAAAIVFRGLSEAPAPAAGEELPHYVARLSRLIAVELIETMRAGDRAGQSPPLAA